MCTSLPFRLFVWLCAWFSSLAMIVNSIDVSNVRTPGSGDGNRMLQLDELNRCGAHYWKILCFLCSYCLNKA